jgi:hypothetical protein
MQPTPINEVEVSRAAQGRPWIVVNGQAVTFDVERDEYVPVIPRDDHRA